MARNPDAVTIAVVVNNRLRDRIQAVARRETSSVSVVVRRALIAHFFGQDGLEADVDRSLREPEREEVVA